MSIYRSYQDEFFGAPKFLEPEDIVQDTAYLRRAALILFCGRALSRGQRRLVEGKFHPFAGKLLDIDTLASKKPFKLW